MSFQRTMYRIHHHLQVNSPTAKRSTNHFKFKHQILRSVQLHCLYWPKSSTNRYKPEKHTRSRTIITDLPRYYRLLRTNLPCPPVNCNCGSSRVVPACTGLVDCIKTICAYHCELLVPVLHFWCRLQSIFGIDRSRYLNHRQTLYP